MVQIWKAYCTLKIYIATYYTYKKIIIEILGENSEFTVLNKPLEPYKLPQFRIAESKLKDFTSCSNAHDVIMKFYITYIIT